MATKEEYAQLSLYGYNVTGLDDNRPNLPSTDWIRLEYHPDDAIGFSYGIFRNIATGEVVVSYTGTNEKQVADFLLANLPAGVGLSSLQVNAAARIAAIAIATYGASNVTFTGHSLGGGLASIMAVWFDRPATIFDSAPFELTARNPLAVISAQNWIALSGLSNSALNGFEVLGNFSQREATVTGYYTSEEALQLLRMGLPEVSSTQNREEFGVDNMLSRRIDLHSQALLTAGLMSVAFREATIVVQRSIPLILDSNFYAYDAATSNKRNFLVDMIRSEQGEGNKLTHFAADLNKLGTNIEGLNKQAQDAIIAQGIEWYYWQGTDYAGQTFFDSSSPAGLLQYTTATGANLQNAENKAASYVEKWLTPIADALGVTYASSFAEYQQWNVSTGSNAATVTAIDTSKSQIFIGQDGGDDFGGGEQDDLFMTGGGDDTLTGGTGGDLLYGGTGYDTYDTGDGDTINDTDGNGIVYLGNSQLGFATRATGETVYTDEDGNTYAWTGGNRRQLSAANDTSYGNSFHRRAA